MALHIRALALAGALASTTIFATPASATSLPATSLGAPLPGFAHSRFDPAAATADWRCRGYGCGYRRGYRRGRVDAGDVLIGAAIIGGIAAIVSSNNRRTRDRDVVILERDVRARYDDPRYDAPRYDGPRYDDRRDVRRDDERSDDRSGPRGNGASGLDSAVDQCVDRIERDRRVETVDNVERTGAGWQVSGTLPGGSVFQCRIGNNGQIDSIDYDGSYSGGADESYAPRADGQWDDERYANARLALGTGEGGMAPQQPAAPQTYTARPAPAITSDRMPAYPGGPIPGEEIPETIDRDL